jgi:hypothetical protein
MRWEHIPDIGILNGAIVCRLSGGQRCSSNGTEWEVS